jgi:hypothetical protein
VIRVKQGATVNVTLVNQGRMPHSLDFHSARTPIANYRNVSPGESFAWLTDSDRRRSRGATGGDGQTDRGPDARQDCSTHVMLRS